MVIEGAQRSSLPCAARFSGRRLFWLLFTLLGAPLIAAIAVIGWDFLDTQRICTFIDANGGFTKLYPGSVTIGDTFGSGDSVDGRPLFRYQIVMVSIGFSSHGDHVDFSQPVKPGAQHPLAVLARLPNLAEVWVSSSRISPEGAACLAHCRRLTRLSLEAKELTAEQLQPLAACRNLRDLTLEDAPLSGAAIAQLQPLAGLESLRFDRAQIDTGGMLELSRMKNLRDLHFFYTTIEPVALFCLSELPKLTTLSISSNDVNRATYQGIGRITGLRSLCLRTGTGWAGERDRPNLGDEIIELAALTDLTDLYLESGRITGTSLDTLLRFTKLQTLHLESELTEDEVIRLANGLKLNEFQLYSPRIADPQRICDEVSVPKLYFSAPGWSWPGYVITSYEPR